METHKPNINTYKIFITIDFNTLISRLMDKYDNIEIKYNYRNGDCIIIIHNLGIKLVYYFYSKSFTIVSTIGVNTILEINSILEGILYVNGKKYNHNFDRFCEELLIIVDGNIMVRKLIEKYKESIINV
ncbi:MAG TPA: hypothetical protein PLC53_03305 [Bacilli bacterium]|nr:hypothetical protein [Bacilli bacterium]